MAPGDRLLGTNDSDPFVLGRQRQYCRGPQRRVAIPNPRPAEHPSPPRIVTAGIRSPRVAAPSMCVAPCLSPRGRTRRVFRRAISSCGGCKCLGRSLHVVHVLTPKLCMWTVTIRLFRRPPQCTRVRDRDQVSHRAPVLCCISHATSASRWAKMRRPILNRLPPGLSLPESVSPRLFARRQPRSRSAARRAE